MKIFLAILILQCVALALSYNCQHCDGDMCCNIPSNNAYYLTDFCAGYPHDETSCGNYCNQFRYFTADRQRFGCGGYLNICGRGKCTKAKVIDAGPADWVEEDAGGPIIDASPAVCQLITGGSSCGWSDHISITAVKASVKDDSELGPWNVTEEEYREIVGIEQRLEEERMGYLPKHWKPQGAPLAGCCSPAQWEGYQFSFDERRHFRAGLNVSYDYTNKRYRVFIEEHNGGFRRRILESIALFDSKELYIIDHTNHNQNESCHKEKLNETMQQDCVPDKAKVDAKITLGGTLKATVYSFQENDNGHVISFTEVRADQNCIPIDAFVSSERIGVDVNYFWDVTLGIKNPAVFTPPSICNTARPTNDALYEKLLQINTHIAKNQLWTLKF